jgi:hypothetical protein
VSEPSATPSGAPGRAASGRAATEGVAADRDEWAGRFLQQADACDELGSTLYGRLLRLLAADVAAGGPTWDVVAPQAGLRFGQAGPLRLVGAAHRLALAGDEPDWASVLPSCGGRPPERDDELLAAWRGLAARRAAELSAGMTREVQTNEVARAAGLALGLSRAGLPDGVRLVELGCSGGLNLRLDRFRIELGRQVLGDPHSAVRLRPELRSPFGVSPALPRVAERIGLDPDPVEATTRDGALTLQSFVWPDQSGRLARLRAALEVAREVPAELRRTGDTAGSLEEVLAGPPSPTVVQHSIVWQYVPTGQRWRITSVLEAAGTAATAAAPLAWVRFEPDEWNRTRAAVWLRTWPGGGDRLVAHADYHGRWLAPVA